MQNRVSYVCYLVEAVRVELSAKTTESEFFCFFERLRNITRYTERDEKYERLKDKKKVLGAKQSQLLLLYLDTTSLDER